MAGNRFSCGVVAILAVLGGCASSPSVREAATVSINILGGSDFHPELRNAVDPAAKPGRLAGEGAMQGLRDCSDADHPVLTVFAAPFCAAIGAASGAAVGAVVTSATTVPDEHAESVSEATWNSAAAVAWRDEFQRILEEDGADRGKSIVPFPGGRVLNIYVEDLAWSVSVGNRLAIRASIVVAVRAGQDFERTSFSLSTPSHSAEHWSADNGIRIREELDLLYEAASDRVWSIVDD